MNAEPPPPSNRFARLPASSISLMNNWTSSRKPRWISGKYRREISHRRKRLKIFAEHGAQWIGKPRSSDPQGHGVEGLWQPCRVILSWARAIRTMTCNWRTGQLIFTTDGCGVETIDFDTGQRALLQSGCRHDGACADYLPSIGFYLADGQRPGSWPNRSPA